MGRRKIITLAQWQAQGQTLFGTADWTKWRFACPSCGHVQTGEQFERIGQPGAAAYQCCIGYFDVHYRTVPLFSPPGPCSYNSLPGVATTGVNPVILRLPNQATVAIFDFAPAGNNTLVSPVTRMALDRRDVPVYRLFFKDVLQWQTF